MKSIASHRIGRLSAWTAAFFCLLSCVEIDSTIGVNFIPKNQTYKTYQVELPIEKIYMAPLDSMSGSSSMRISLGAIRDEESGLSTRSSAFSLVPLYDSLDFGDPGTQVYDHFRLHAMFDTISVAHEDQRYILQNVNVYALNKPLSLISNINSEIDYDASKRISNGVPVLNGSMNLTFEFSPEFGERYMHIGLQDTKDIQTYLSKYPGIFLETDEPSGEGGRFNFFKLQLDYEDNYLNANFAELSFSARYNGVLKDTTFIFLFGLTGFYDTDSLLTSSSTGYLPQSCVNVTGISDENRLRAGLAEKEIILEGGGGLHPMIRARDLQEMMRGAIAPYGDPDHALINRARIILPFDKPDDPEVLNGYPPILSPGVKVRYSADTVSYFVLTDYSETSQDHGDMNRSLFEYSPDFTYHAQSILTLDPKANASNYDLWFLIQATETITSQKTGLNEDLLEYYQNMLYSSYYNNMYNGYNSYYGGGYGGYGGYGYNNYNNYYYMWQIQSMMEQAESTTQVQTVMLDNDRYYNARLLGPKSTGGRVPKLKFVFSIPEE